MYRPSAQVFHFTPVLVAMYHDQQVRDQATTGAVVQPAAPKEGANTTPKGAGSALPVLLGTSRQARDELPPHTASPASPPHRALGSDATSPQSVHPSPLPPLAPLLARAFYATPRPLNIHLPSVFTRPGHGVGASVAIRVGDSAIAAESRPKGACGEGQPPETNVPIVQQPGNVVGRKHPRS